MGYTHYVIRPRELDREKFEAAARDCAKVFEAARARGIGLAGPDGDGEPLATPHGISLNGSGDEGAYEPFVVLRVSDGRDSGGEVFEFCKTARLPYDAAVTACLVVLKHHFGDAVRVASDGRTEDWAAGLALAAEAGVGGEWAILGTHDGRSLVRAEGAPR